MRASRAGAPRAAAEAPRAASEAPRAAAEAPELPAQLLDLTDDVLRLVLGPQDTGPAGHRALASTCRRLRALVLARIRTRRIVHRPAQARARSSARRRPVIDPRPTLSAAVIALSTLPSLSHLCIISTHGPRCSPWPGIARLDAITRLTRLELEGSASEDAAQLPVWRLPPCRPHRSPLAALGIREPAEHARGLAGGLAGLAPTLRHLRLQRVGLRHGDARLLAALTALTRLDLDDNSIGSAQAFSSLTQLSHLSLSAADLHRDYDGTGLLPLMALTALQSLNLSANHSLGGTLGALSACRDLHTLSLDGNELHYEALRALAGCTRLRALSLSGAVFGEAQDLGELSSLSVLTTLHALHLFDVRIEDGFPLEHLTALTRLALSDSIEASAGDPMPSVATLTALRELRIDGAILFTGYGAHDVEVDLAALSALTALTLLTADNCALHDSQVMAIARITSLQHLSLREEVDSHLTGAALAALRPCTALRILAIAVCQVGTRGADALTELAGHSLQHLVPDYHADAGFGDEAEGAIVNEVIESLRASGVEVHL